MGGKVLGKDEAKIKESLDVLKNRFKPKSCKFCGDEIAFKEVDGKAIPHDSDGTPHWLTCPYGKAMKKKLAPQILRKLAVYLVVKYGPAFEAEAGLTKKETQVIHSILEYAFKESSEKSDASNETVAILDEEEQVFTPASTEAAATPDDEGLVFSPAPSDPIGDPDEDRAPSEEEIQRSNPEEFTKVEDTTPKE